MGGDTTRDIVTWQAPTVEEDALAFRFGRSIIDEFALSHGAADVLRELAQNEFDARGTQMEITFDRNVLHVKGNGRVIDDNGWQRLSVVLGTGEVAGSAGEEVTAKANSIGSKNLGLRSLFLFGDRIFIRSGGRQTVLDRNGGAYSLPRSDTETRRTFGVRISVPYRTRASGPLPAFTVDQEQQAVARIAADLASMLIKLALPRDQKQGLHKITVVSVRTNRRITVTQNVERVAGGARAGNVWQRTVHITESGLETRSGARRQTINEIEFWSAIKPPVDIIRSELPSYFHLPGGKIRLGISFRTNGKLLLSEESGSFYYPIAVPGGHTGCAFSAIAPLQMNENRSAIISPDTSRRNRWLLDEIAGMAVELLKRKEFAIYGAQSYLCIRPTAAPAACNVVERIGQNLNSMDCWRSRAVSDGGRPKYVTARSLVVPEKPLYDDFLGSERYLDDALAGNEGVRVMALKAGAKRFTMNSLVRLHCAGKDRANLKTKIGQDEADDNYTDHTAAISRIDNQVRFAEVCEAEVQHLTQTQRADICQTHSTLSAAGSLAPCEALWHIHESLRSVCPVPPSQQLHPRLAEFKVYARFAKEFELKDWAAEALERIREGVAPLSEREALYELILEQCTKFSKELRKQMGGVPVLLDHDGTWTCPRQIISRRAAYADELAPVLHFPNQRYEEDEALADKLEFRTRIDDNDLIAYARWVAQNPEHADQFEKVLNSCRRILTQEAAKQLSGIAFLRSSKGGLDSPSNLYIESRQVRSVVGTLPAAVAGHRVQLYVQLGCRQEPRAYDVIRYLEALRASGTAPADPLHLYTALVEASDRAGYKPDYWSAHPILWTSQGYKSPASAIVPQKGILLQCLPQVRGIPPGSYRIPQLLGASQAPHEEHWIAVCKWLDVNYGQTHQVLPPTMRSELVQAYRKHLNEYFDAIPPDLCWLLDEEGRLYSKDAIARKELLLNDEPRLAAAIAQQGRPAAFASETVCELLQAPSRPQLTRLTEARDRSSTEATECSDRSYWVRPDEMLALIHDTNARSVFYALAANVPRNARQVRLPSRHDFYERVSAIRSVVVAETIRVTYTLGGAKVTVDADNLFDNNRILLTKPGSKNDMYRKLANALADICIEGVAERRILASSYIFVLSCGVSNGRQLADLTQFLADKGIAWKPIRTGRRVEDADESAESSAELASADTFTEQTPNQSMEGDKDALLGLIAQWIPSAPDVHYSDLQGLSTEACSPFPAATAGKLSPDQDGADKSWALRDIETTELQECTPSLKRRDKGGKPIAPRTSRSGGGIVDSDPLREQQIGRRGEELVYRRERERLSALGLPSEAVVWQSNIDPFLDFDIQSLADDGSPIWIEVKSTTGKDGAFEWSKAEFLRAWALRERYILCRVYEVDSPRATVKRFVDPIGLLLDERLTLDIARLHAQVEPMSD